MLPRNVRNNNPGNIDIGPQWVGLMSRDQMDPEQAAEERFAVFVTPAYGFRAMIRELNVYHAIHDCKTVRQFINRWAPDRSVAPADRNDTEAYVKDVSGQINADPDAELPWPAIAGGLAKAITTHETGSWEPFWHDDDLTEGEALAGLGGA